MWKTKNILFVGDLNEFGRGFQRYRTLKELNYSVIGFTHTAIFPLGKIEHPNFYFRILAKLRIPPDPQGMNKSICRIFLDKKIDIIWIEKGNMIWPSTLRYVKERFPETKLISISEDDMYANHGHSIFYRLGIKYYDVVFTTKAYNLSELKYFGAVKTCLFLDSYDELVHKPMELTREEKDKFSCDVSAIGAYEKERAALLLYLANKGVKVVIWGGGWERLRESHPNLIVKHEFLFGDDYPKAICASKINLNFLRKINRDEITSRSMEIPACGGFMLAERTKRHLETFEEGKEVDYFESNEDLFRKVDFYLKNPNEREAIAIAGRQRCLASGYSTRSQIIQILTAVSNSQ